GTGRGRLVSQLFQPAAQQGAEQGPAQAPLLQPAPGVENPADEEATVAVPAPALGGGAQEGETEDGALLGPVQIQFVEGSDMILIRGNKRDVARVMEIINRIEQISAETVPAVEVLQLQHVDSRSMG